MATDSDSALRRKYAQQFMSVVSQKDLHSALPVKDSDGASPIVVALGHERADTVFARIEHAGGAANLVIVDSADGVHVVSMMPSHSEGRLNSLREELADVHKNITMDFLVMYMKENRGDGVFRISIPGVNLEAHRSEGGELVGAL